MSIRPRHQRLIAALALAGLGVVALPVRDAIGWDEHPFAGVLVDPDGLGSNLGLPTWDGLQQGLRYPHQIRAGAGEPLVAPPGGASRAETWDRAVEAAARAG